MILWLKYKYYYNFESHGFQLNYCQFEFIFILKERLLTGLYVIYNPNASTSPSYNNPDDQEISYRIWTIFPSIVLVLIAHSGENQVYKKYMLDWHYIAKN